MGSSRGALRASLRAGAVYDVVLGIGILFLGRRLLAALGYAVLPPAFLFRLAALPLFLLPALYLAAARATDPDPFRGPVLWARGVGGLIVLALVLAHRPPAAGIYAAVGAADLVWAAVHAGLWRKRER